MYTFIYIYIFLFYCLTFVDNFPLLSNILLLFILDSINFSDLLFLCFF